MLPSQGKALELSCNFRAETQVTSGAFKDPRDQQSQDGTKWPSMSNHLEYRRRSVIEMTLNLLAFVNQDMTCVLPALDSCLQVFRKKPLDFQIFQHFIRLRKHEVARCNAELAAGSGLENS
jgi:hypothetical protein